LTAGLSGAAAPEAQPAAAPDNPAVKPTPSPEVSP
jgi:hypothetical protein